MNNNKEKNVIKEKKKFEFPFKKGKNKKTTKENKTVKKIDKKKKKNILKIVLIAGLTLFIIGLIATIVFISYVIKSSPEFNPNNLYQKESSVIYDKDGEVITKIGSQIREIISYNQMPQVMVDAIVATEDSRFFTHGGFDLPRFIKASIGQVSGNSGAGGASTITMQLSKNVYTSTEASGFKGIVRKFTDIYISMFKIERNYSKEEILEFYLNSNFLGSGSYGIEQASQTYFGKSAKDMNLSEAALVAGLFNAPGALDPNINPEGAIERRNVVLSLMNRHGYISEEEMNIAKKQKIEDMLVERDQTDDKYMAFINTVTEEVEDKTGMNPYTVPMEIYTTMDRDKQAHMDDIFNADGYNWENDVVTAGVSVLDVNTGAIVAVGAGRNHTSHKIFNNATMIKRQIGSTSKPLFDYGPFIEYNNASTYTLLADEPHGYSNGIDVFNWDMKYKNVLTLREALKTSRNIPPLKVFQSLKQSNLKEFVSNLGLSPEIQDGIIHEAHSIGGYNGESPQSLAAAYAAFGNGGFYNEPYSYDYIILKETNEKIENTNIKRRAMKESTAYMISSVLQDAGAWGFGSRYSVNGVKFAGKTGTTNFDNETAKAFGLPSSAINDLWAAGYNTEYSIGLWYGYDKIYKEHFTKFGNNNHSLLFQAVAKGIFESKDNFEMPSSVVRVNVEKDSHPAKLPSEFTPSNMIISELFVKGTEPTEVSKRFAKLDEPTNISFTSSGNKLTISWEEAEKPDFADRGHLNSIYSNLFKNDSYKNSYIDGLLKYTNDNLGKFGYRVYVQNEDALVFLGFTEDTNFEYNLTSTGDYEFVVKSSYSKYEKNISDGISKTFEFSDNFIVNLTSSAMIEVDQGDPYTEPAQPVSAIYDGETVTGSISLSKIIMFNSAVVDSIDTSKVGDYLITYKIEYDGNTKFLNKTVKIK